MATPKPIISRVMKSLRVPPGMIYALVADIEKNLWVVESCPAGTKFWTLEQASDLPQGPRTHQALQEILKLGRYHGRQLRSAVPAVPGIRLESPLRAPREITLDRAAPRRARVERTESLRSRTLVGA